MAVRKRRKPVLKSRSRSGRPQPRGKTQVELRYSEAEVAFPAEYVYWAAAAAAEWDGRALVNPRALALTYTMQQQDAPALDISVICAPVDKQRSILQVHANRVQVLRRGDPFTLDSEVEAEAAIIASILNLLELRPRQWPIRERGPLVEGFANLRIEGRGENVTFFVNGVHVPARKARAKVRTQSGFYRIEGRSETANRGFDVVHTLTEGNEPQSLLAYAAAYGGVAIPAALNATVQAAGQILAVVIPKLPPLPVPAPAPPGIPPVPPAAGTAIVAVALLAVSYKTATQILEDIEVIIDITDIDIDNETRERFCCCRWERTDQVFWPRVIFGGVYVRHFECFRRVRYRTMLRPNTTAPCPCPLTTMFGPTLTVSTNPNYPAQLILLPPAPSTSLRAFAGVRCGRQGELDPVSIGSGFSFVGVP